MNDKSDVQLLRDYAESGNEAAFREIVARHTDFIYSAALRQVDSADLAADIAQTVFVDLARKAKSISERWTEASSLAGWLYRATRYTSLNHLRDTRRQHTNERQAMEHLFTNSGPVADWEQIRPALDEAMDSLGDEDREALLLRYFKNQDLRAVGRALGMSDDAAQKRVSRAVDRLREFFSKRKVTISASGLTVLISASAVQAAPIGLAATISASAILAGTTVSTSTAIAATKVIAMTTLQKTIIGTALVVAVGTGIYEAYQGSQLRELVQTFQQQQAPMAEQIQLLQRERDDATNRLAGLLAENQQLQSDQQETELLKLRAAVTRLKAMSVTNASNSSISSKKQEEINALFKQIQDLARKANSLYAVDGRLLVLKQRLHLTPEQEAKVRNILAQKYAANEIDMGEPQTLVPDIAPILTPEQKLAAEQLAQEEWQNTRNGQVSAAAESDLRGLQFYLGLNEQQQAEALPVLEDYQVKMYQLQDTQKESRPVHPFWGLEPFSQELTNQKLEAMKKVLSAEQFEIYKSYEESILEEARLVNLDNQLKTEE